MNEEQLASRDSLPLAVWQRIDSVCQRFEDAWREDLRPKIESFLGNLGQPERSALLRELLGLDLAYWRRHGHRPAAVEYEQRFPEHVDLVRLVFVEAAARKAVAKEIAPSGQPQPGAIGDPAMPMHATPHPTPNQLEAFHAGLIADAEAQQVESHLSGCAACQAALESLPEDDLVVRCRKAGSAISGATPLPADTGKDLAVVGAAGSIPANLADHPRYLILNFLGVGGMGAVYKAQHKVIKRLVALKVIGNKLADQPEAIERFHREAEAAAQLKHPNIVVIHDADQAGATHFLVMEFIEGVTLGQLVKQGGPLPVHEACICADQACWACSMHTKKAWSTATSSRTT